MNLQELIARYIEVRDKRDNLTKLYKERAARIDHVLNLMEGALLKLLDDGGMESIRTESGTVFTSTRTSATVADRDAFLEFIKGNEAWIFLENRVSKNAVEQYVTVNEAPPPGINLRVERVVNIRRPK